MNQMANDSVVKIPVHSEVLHGLLRQLSIENIEELLDEHSLFERNFQ